MGYFVDGDGHNGRHYDERDDLTLNAHELDDGGDIVYGTPETDGEVTFDLGGKSVSELMERE